MLRTDQLLVGLGAGALPLLLAALLNGPLLGGAVFSALHAAVLLFLVVACGATFTAQWYAAASGVDEARGRFAGAAFLGLAALEALHLVSVPGMAGFLAPPGWDHGIYWWHAARAWTALCLLAVAFVPERSGHVLLRRGPSAAVALLLVAILVALELRLAGTGALLTAGGGATALRRAVEALTALAAALGVALHLRRHRARGERLHARVAAALGLVVLGQAAYGLSAGPEDLLAGLAHGYDAVAAWLVFDAVFTVALLEPQRRLTETSRELQATNLYLEQLRGRVEGELAETIGELAATTEREVKARAELEAAFAAAPEALIVVSPAGQVLRQNETARALFDGDADLHGDSVHQRWRLLRPRTTDGRPLSLQEHPVERALRGETVRGLVLEIRPPGRPATWIAVSAAPIRAEGVLVGAVAAVADVSALQALQGQLEDMVRAVGHDLRSPLQIVQLQAERLQRAAEERGGERERRAAAAALAACRRMAGMIRDLVDAARLDGGRLALACRSLDLRAWLPELVGQSASGLDASRLRLELAPDLPLAWADPARIDRVVLNLVQNALAHAPEGEVVVRAAAEDEVLRVSVEDRGPGLDAEELPRVFDRFYRGKSARSGEGLGLGLFISRVLVEAHGGRIRADSPPGRGAVFSFTLPLALPPTPPPPPSRAHRAAAP